MTRFLVAAVHRIAGRPWALVTGNLAGDALRAGDEMELSDRTGTVHPVVIRSIEMHGPPGTTTLAVDAAFADLLGAGSILRRG
ncbi:hypothetical protein [Actinoplanes palleronii]|uniref:Uncharacterized protein n=1 Tax=Actinoplanes palleronii TaxID=113570 RepID=A0ABQ4B127_9ACTN|nr:hypothetical protein [Actinoplanes palleronii]GIE64371.1 hypothetical protein Apa02nite_004790 [Actinoplanes palleronii]